MISAIDLFCGAGGTSTGLALATGGNYRLTAINHWDVAVETHAKNHPQAEHLCKGIDTLDPRKVHKGKLDLLLASPECTHHSIARGGKPMEDQSRASAWEVVRWAEALLPRQIIVENVKEFETWGPLDSKAKRPLKSRKGETFRAWVQAIQSLGYQVDWKVLNSADFGAATTRRRLFVRAQRGRGPIAWPHSTHAKVPDLLTPTRWRAASEIIDWSIPGTSIFSRKKPLAPATLARIEAGLKKFGGANAEPFLVILRQHQAGMSVKAPVPTITTSGAHIGLCQPFAIGQQSDAAPRLIDQPLPTIATAGAISLVQPFMVTAAFGEGTDRRVQSLGGPVPALTGSNQQAIVQPLIMPLNHGAKDFRAHDPSSPMPTITGVDAWGQVQPLLVEYYGNGEARPVNVPCPTVVTRDRFGLVEFGYDILFRMLQPHELAAAMGFPREYQFAGTRDERVKQIGNAVEVNQARALISAALDYSRSLAA